MIININHLILTDAPLGKANQNLLIGTNHEEADIISDLRYGVPTCYLVSGYRGAGKTSFVNNIQFKFEGIQADLQHAFIFVNLKIPKYYSKTYLLRSLIRGLFHQIKSYPSFLDKLKNEPKLKARPATQLQDLYEKTFHQTIQSSKSSNSGELTTSLDINLGTIIGKALLFSFSSVFLILNIFFKWLQLYEIIDAVGALLSAVYAISTFIKLNTVWTTSRSTYKAFQMESLYDDEIADYFFIDTLQHLSEDYNIVFVLDELDKIEENELSVLINEMKPYFISGYASFLIVAGQNLYHQFRLSQLKDDALLSSIFSRTIHVPLMSRQEFRQLFRNLRSNAGQEYTVEENQLVDEYVDKLILQSNRIPRRFITTLRQDLTWLNGTASIDIIPGAENEKLYTSILDAVDQITEIQIKPEGYPSAMQDFYIMQLYLLSHRLLATNGNEFTIEDLIKYDEQSER
jgi:hypothetical protein